MPELGGFIAKLPEDPAAKKSAVNDFITLMEDKNCTSADEYIQLINILVELEPNSFDTKLKQAKRLSQERSTEKRSLHLKNLKLLLQTMRRKTKFSTLLLGLNSQEELIQQHTTRQWRYLENSKEKL